MEFDLLTGKWKSEAENAGGGISDRSGEGFTGFFSYANFYFYFLFVWFTRNGMIRS